MNAEGGGMITTLVEYRMQIAHLKEQALSIGVRQRDIDARLRELARPDDLDQIVSCLEHLITEQGGTPTLAIYFLR